MYILSIPVSRVYVAKAVV